MVLALVAVIVWRSTHLPRPGDFASIYDETLDDPRLNTALGPFECRDATAAEAIAAFERHIGIKIGVLGTTQDLASGQRSTIAIKSGLASEQVQELSYDVGCWAYVMHNGQLRLCATYKDACENRVYDLRPFADLLRHRTTPFEVTVEPRIGDTIVIQPGSNDDAIFDIAFGITPDLRSNPNDNSKISSSGDLFYAGEMTPSANRYIARRLDRIWWALKTNKPSLHFNEPALAE